jgi:hypothetical protein
MREGLAWFDAVLSDRPEPSVTPAVWVRAVTDHSVLANGVAAPGDPARAQEALALARQLDDRALIVAALTACGALTIYDATTARAYFAEAAELARAAGDRRRLCGV